jgi:uncharacterized phage-associated protein
MASQDGRLSEVAHYVIAHCTPEKLGATKLNKVLWYSDVIFYRLHGRTITGAEAYEKRQYGPVPKDIYGVIRSLRAAGKIKERVNPTPAGPRREFVWLEAPTVGSFSAEEIDVLRDVMEQVCEGHSAASISDLTHDALWDETEIGQEMSVRAGAIFPAEITPDAMRWAKGAFDEYRTAGNRFPD